MQSAETNRIAKRHSRPMRFLRGLASSVFFSLISMGVYAECNHETVYTYHYNFIMNNATYDRQSNSLVISTSLQYVKSTSGGTLCHWSPYTFNGVIYVNVDGRVVGKDLPENWSYSLGGSYTFVVPGKSANNISLSGSGRNLNVIGNSYTSPYVAGMNEAPQVVNRGLSVNEDSQGTIALSAIDPDAGDSHSFQIVSQVNSAHGSAYISGSTLFFTPAANWNGTTSLTYKATDSMGESSNVATVSITVSPVNDPPVAQTKSLTVNEDTSGTVTLSAIDIDSPAPTVFQIVSAPNASHGSASISGSTLTFTPAADWNGSTSLTYRAQDTSGAWSAPATVSITVTSANDAPVAAAKSLTTAEDTAGNITLSATDIDSPAPAVFQIVRAPNASHGSATLSGSTLSFTPAANWNGTTTMTYRAQDSSGAWSDPATVSITVKPVNDPPVAQEKNLTTDEDTSGSVTLTATDIDSPAPIIFQIVSPPNSSHGSASISGSTLSFTPVDDWNGTTTLTYRAQDSNGAWSSPVTVTITVRPVNDPPVAQAKSLTIDEDTSGSVALSATDIDSPTPAIFQIVSSPNAAHGSATISGSSLTFTPTKDWNGATTLTYRAQDNSGAWSDPVTVTITVRPVNDPPVAQVKTLTVDEDTSGSVTLTATDIDSPTPTTFQIVSPPNAAHGSATLSGSTLGFTPAKDWNGTTTLTYRAQDSSGAWSAPVAVTITVRPVNDKPKEIGKLTIRTTESVSATARAIVTD